MPIYEYLCPDCDHRFETYVKAWGEEVTCPCCQKGGVEKQLSSFALAGSRASSSSPSGGGGCGCGRGGCGCRAS
jgi:putative FmdB family regulatory protein